MDATGGKAGLCSRHRQVALGHQLAARRSRHAMHARYDRHGQLVNGQHHAAALCKQLLVVSQLGVGRHVLEVVPRTKGLARASQHHHARSVIPRHIIQRLLQCREHFTTQGVEAGGVVQSQGDHAARITGDLKYIVQSRCCHVLLSSAKPQR